MVKKVSAAAPPPQAGIKRVKTTTTKKPEPMSEARKQQLAREFWDDLCAHEWSLVRNGDDYDCVPNDELKKSQRPLTLADVLANGEARAELGAFGLSPNDDSDSEDEESDDSDE